MKIYLVRHGKAADEGYRVDAHRPLTNQGRERMRRTARAWAKRGDGEPQLWLVSPLVRAVQTCEICVDAFGSEGPVEVTDRLIPNALTGDAADLFARKDVESIAAVGHEPLMSALASHLLGIRFGDFKKGMVLALERRAPEKPMRLRWILHPARREHDPSFHEET